MREPVGRWAEAVRRGDPAGVLDARVGDIVVFGVPPPRGGVRGIAAYREVRPPFVARQASGAVFATDSPEVTAGTEAAPRPRPGETLHRRGTCGASRGRAPADSSGARRKGAGPRPDEAPSCADLFAGWPPEVALPPGPYAGPAPNKPMEKGI
jgi:hypothetical protein